MPVVDKNQLKLWFKNLAKPVQEQFWNWMDSFYHKFEPIPQNGVENLTTDLSKKADLVGGVVPASQLPFTVNTSEVIAIGEITTTVNSVTLGVHSSGANAVRLNGVVYTRQFPSSFNYTAVTTGNKFLIIYAINDSGLFRLAEGVEGLEAIEPELPAGALYVRRIFITPNGQHVDNNLLAGFKEKKEDTWKIHTFLQAGVPNFLSFNDGRSSYILQKQNGLTGPFILGGIARKYDDYNWWGGKEFTILNFTGYDVELQNYPTFDSDTQATFSPSSTPYVLKNGYIVKVKVSDDDYIMEVIRTSSSSDTDGVENKSDIDGATATEALNNLQAFNLGLLMGTNRPLLSRSAFSLISELDENGWPKQMAWVSYDDKRVNIADIETGQTHSTLDTRDLITYGVSNALIQFVTKIYETTFPINMGVFVNMSMFVVYYPLPRQVTLRFTIDHAYNISNAKAYKLKINNTTSSAQVILDLTNATTVNGNELVITFLDNAQMEHTTEIQEFEIYKDGQDESGIPTYNWLTAYKQNKLSGVTGNVGVGKDDASATEKLDVAGRVKSDGVVINETTSAILPREIKFKGGNFVAAGNDGVEKKLLREGDVSSGGNLVDYVHDINQEIYISSINYATGYITTSTPHGLTVGTRYRSLMMPNAFKNRDYLNYKRDWQSVPIEYLNGGIYVEAIDNNTVVIKNYLFNIITVNTSDASNVALNPSNWHIEVMNTGLIELPVNNNSVKDFTLEYDGFVGMYAISFALNTINGVVNNIGVGDTATGVFGSIVPHVILNDPTVTRLNGASFQFSIDKKISALKATGLTTTRNAGASSYTTSALNQFAGASFTKFLSFSENIGLAKIIISNANLRIANGTSIKLR